jgi:hypothetical protein
MSHVVSTEQQNKSFKCTKSHLDNMRYKHKMMRFGILLESIVIRLFSPFFFTFYSEKKKIYTFFNVLYGEIYCLY